MRIADEVTARITKVSEAFCKLRGHVWDQTRIRLDTKLKVYKAVELSIVFYIYRDIDDVTNKELFNNAMPKDLTTATETV